MSLSNRFASTLVASLLLSATAFAQGTLMELPGNASESFGYEVASLGDLNGDGFPEVAASAISGWDGSQPVGILRIYSGFDGSLFRTEYGVQYLGLYGYAFCAVGDWNHDGVNDYAVSERDYDVSVAQQDVGRVFIRSGSTGATIVTYWGENGGDKFGHDLAAADVDKDGYTDLIIGIVSDDTTNGVDSGSVKVISGKTNAVLYHFIGASADDQLGVSVDAPGDLDGDGWQDILAGANFGNSGLFETGMVRAWSGKTGLVMWTRTGNVGSQFGAEAIGIGDVDLDGKPDVAIGAISDKSQGFTTGLVLVVKGNTGVTLNTIYGAGATDFGTAICAMPDLTGDGRPEIAVGAPYGPNNATGEVRVYSSVGTFPLQTLPGANPDSWIGYALDCADVNQDGVLDLLIGSMGHEINGINTGLLRVVSGTCGTIAAYGTGCPGTGGFIPQLAAGGCATPGGTMSLSIAQAFGGSNAIVFFGLQQTAMPISGCTLLTFPLIASVVVPLAGNGPGNGFMVAQGKLPIDMPLLSFAMQAFVIDPLHPRGFSTTKGAWVTVK